MRSIYHSQGTEKCFFYSVNPARHESGGPARNASQREAGGSAGRVTSKSRAWVSFFWIMPHIVLMSGSFKMVYIDGAYDSKAYGSINHFESTQ